MVVERLPLTTGTLRRAGRAARNARRDAEGHEPASSERPVRSARARQALDGHRNRRGLLQLVYISCSLSISLSASHCSRALSDSTPVPLVRCPWTSLLVTGLRSQLQRSTCADTVGSTGRESQGRSTRDRWPRSHSGRNEASPGRPASAARAARDSCFGMLRSLLVVHTDWGSQQEAYQQRRLRSARRTGVDARSGLVAPRLASPGTQHSGWSLPGRDAALSHNACAQLPGSQPFSGGGSLEPLCP